MAFLPLKEEDFKVQGSLESGWVKAASRYGKNPRVSSFASDDDCDLNKQ